MKHVLMFAAALTIGTAALAQTEYPKCSKNVQDHCMNDMSRESDTHGGMPAHPEMRHDMRGHHMMHGHHRGHHMMKHHHKH